MFLDLRALVSRRATVGGLVAGALGVGAARAAGAEGHGVHAAAYGHFGDNRMVGVVDHGRNGFDPSAVLTDFDHGEVSVGPDGRAVREWVVTAVDREIEVAPGIVFPAWTYNGRVPGPSFRCVEGERLRFVFQNGGSHPHSMHFHGIHSWRMDGVPGAGVIAPGEEHVYEFDARPFGCHLYHCHALPLKRHIHKGMYGVFVIDPDPERHPDERAAAAARRHGTPEHARWQELVMVMNGFDTNFDDENEVYAVNSIPFAYVNAPVRVERGRPVRVYLVNITEFDPINSFHLHGNFFDFYDHGTTLAPTLRNIDTVMLCQGQRGILEFGYAEHEPGIYMFHAHQSEFAELGWMSHFEVV
jgi:FtsP/CotA-like multicopper oxidase with cupredoxin domain